MAFGEVCSFRFIFQVHVQFHVISLERIRTNTTHYKWYSFVFFFFRFLLISYSSSECVRWNLHKICHLHASHQFWMAYSVWAKRTEWSIQFTHSWYVLKKRIPYAGGFWIFDFIISHTHTQTEYRSHQTEILANTHIAPCTMQTQRIHPKQEILSIIEFCFIHFTFILNTLAQRLLLLCALYAKRYTQPCESNVFRNAFFF